MYKCGLCKRIYKRRPWLIIIDRDTLDIRGASYRCRRCKNKRLWDNVSFRQSLFYYGQEPGTPRFCPNSEYGDITSGIAHMITQQSATSSGEGCHFSITDFPTLSDYAFKIDNLSGRRKPSVY